MSKDTSKLKDFTKSPLAKGIFQVVINTTLSVLGNILLELAQGNRKEEYWEGE